MPVIFTLALTRQVSERRAVELVDFDIYPGEYSVSPGPTGPP